MKYRNLGRTGIKVSPYCLGAMMFGARGNPDHEDSVRIIHKALDAGINFLDTADVYSRGESEEIVGKALKGRRNDIVLATKAFGSMGDDPNHQGGSRRWLVREVEASLRRLQTDHIDLYQIHRPSPDTDIEETLSALTDLLSGQDTRVWIIHLPGLRHRRGAMGRRASWPRALSRRTAPVFNTRSHGRTRSAAGMPEVWDGRAGMEPAGERHAQR